MAEENEELSIDFYYYVCNIIGTEEVVKKRREIFKSMDCVLSESKVLFISSGSKAEGLDLKGSDIDLMFCRTDMRVYEDDSKVFRPKRSMPNLIMETYETKPGFTLLRAVTANFLLHRRDLFHDKYLSSKSFREYYIAKLADLLSHVEFVIHGPCVSHSNESYDYAMCLRCREWILPAKQWISRPRNIWPDTSTIRQMVDYGVLFVPIGCKGSPNEDLEWRISFSVAEKELIYTFNHVQFLCYALLKIALNDVIKKRYKDLLCSYFLKTVMFWVCEESCQSSWKPKYFIKCFMNCFRRLVYCVEYKICLHYFIPDSNFFEDRFTASQHYDLLSFLRTLNNSGWSWILHTDTIQSYNRYLNVLPYIPVVSSFQNLSLEDGMPCTKEELNVKMRKRMFYLSICGNDMFIYRLSAFSQKLAQTMLIYEECNKGNKQRYIQYRRCRSYLMIGFNTDAVSGWLLLASLFYTYKQYRECIHVIEYCLSKCTPDKILLTLKPDVEDQSRFERFMYTLGRGKFLSTCKQCLIDNALFLETRILPDEIRIFLDRFEYLYMPNVVFAHFLKFLCLSHLGNDREQHDAFRDLQLTVHEKYFIRQDEHVIKNADLCLYIAGQMLIQK